MYLEQMLETLPSCYNKDINGNIGKLFNLVGNNLEELNALLTKINAWRDIDQAEGFVLDKIGKNLGQTRGTLADIQYRLLLKIKRKQSTSNCSVNSIIDIIKNIFDCSFTDITLQQIFPFHVAIVLPADFAVQHLISEEELQSFLQGTLAAGIVLTITFAFQVNQSINVTENIYKTPLNRGTKLDGTWKIGTIPFGILGNEEQIL